MSEEEPQPEVSEVSEPQAEQAEEPKVEETAEGTQFWKSQAEGKEEEIKRLQEQIANLEKNGAQTKKKFDPNSKILEQAVLEVSKKQDGSSTEDASYELDGETLEQLVMEFATFKNEKNREIEDLKTNLECQEKPESSASEKEEPKTEEQNGESSESNDKQVTFENGTAELAEEKASEFYEPDTSKLVRADANNTDVLLSTLVREMQDLKTKVSLIERAVVLTDADRPQPSTHATHVAHVPSQSAPAYKVPPIVIDEGHKYEDTYRDAYREKSHQLEDLQRDISALRRQQRMLHFKSSVTPTRPGVSPRRGEVRSEKLSRGALSERGQAAAGRQGASKLKSILKPRAHQPADADVGGSSEEELTQYSPSSYDVTTRPAADFHWTPGVGDLGSRALSKDTFDRATKYLRKVQKRYDREHIDIEDDNSGDIEKQLRNNFVENENGLLEYRIPSHNYGAFD